MPNDDTATPTIEVDKMKNRRAMAWASFFLMLIINLPLIVLGMSSDVMATRVDRMAIIVGLLNSIYASIIFAYYGVTTFTDLRTK